MSYFAGFEQDKVHSAPQNTLNQSQLQSQFLDLSTFAYGKDKNLNESNLEEKNDNESFNEVPDDSKSDSRNKESLDEKDSGSQIVYISS